MNRGELVGACQEHFSVTGGKGWNLWNRWDGEDAQRTGHFGKDDVGVVLDVKNMYEDGGHVGVRVLTCGADGEAVVGWLSIELVNAVGVRKEEA